MLQLPTTIGRPRGEGRCAFIVEQKEATRLLGGDPLD
jgi:hypothetical protein